MAQTSASQGQQARVQQLYDALNRGLGRASERAFAGTKALQNTIFLGQDDKLIAGLQTAMGQGRGGWADRYNQNLRQQNDRMETVARAHPLSTSVGEAAGIGTALMVGNPFAIGRSGVMSVVKTVPRYRPAKPPSPRLQTKPREYATVVAGTGLLNGGLEGAASLATGHTGTVGDYAGATIGGALGGLATFGVGPRLGAAVEGGMTPVAQALLNGRAISPREVRNRVAAGAFFANTGEVSSIRKVNNLSSKQKGRLGEALSVAKTLARLDLPLSLQEDIHLALGGKTVADQLTLTKKIVEAKFGQYARLTHRQRQAKAEFPERYRHDHWQKEDVGKIGGYGLGNLGTNAIALPESEY